MGALAFGHIDTDADKARRATLGVVDNDAVRFHHARRVLAWPDDAKLIDDLGDACGKRFRDRIGHAHHVFAEHAAEPAFVAAVEFVQSIQSLQLWRQPDGSRWHMPFEYAQTAGFLHQSEQLLTVSGDRVLANIGLP